jgi:hypothetical protein
MSAYGVTWTSASSSATAACGRWRAGVTWWAKSKCSAHMDAAVGVLAVNAETG